MPVKKRPRSDEFGNSPTNRTAEATLKARNPNSACPLSGALQASAFGCGFSRSMQHLDSHCRGEDVAHEVPDGDPVHRSRQGVDVGTLAIGRFDGVDPRTSGRGRGPGSTGPLGGRPLLRRSHTQIATLVERHTRYVMLVRVVGKDTATVVNALIKQAHKLPRDALQVADLGPWQGNGGS